MDGIILEVFKMMSLFTTMCKFLKRRPLQSFINIMRLFFLLLFYLEQYVKLEFVCFFFFLVSKYRASTKV